MLYAEIMQQRERLIQECRAILEKAEKENRDVTAEEKALWDKKMADAEDLKRKADKAPVYEPLQPPGNGDSQRADEHSFPIQTREGNTVLALRPTGRLYRAEQYQRYRERGIDVEALSLDRFLRGKLFGDWTGAEMERRALSEGQDTFGGYIVPAPLSDRLIDLARNQTRVIQAGAITVPMSTETLSVARVVTDPTASWVLENQVIPSSDMTFGKWVFTARKLACLVKVSQEVFEDSALIGNSVETAIAAALALELDRVCLYGQGAAGVPGPGLKYDADILTRLLGANGDNLGGYGRLTLAWRDLLEANCPEDGLSIIMSARERGTLEAYADANGNPLVSPDWWKALKKLSTNQIETNQVQGTATNASDAFLGKFDQFWIALRRGIVLEASRTASDATESAFTKHQLWIKATLRADVGAVRPSWFNRVYGILPE